MMHKSAMNNKNLICSGYRVANHLMSETDLAWATAAAGNVIRQDEGGNWFHTMITDRDRKSRASYWKPDTGRERNMF